MGVVRGGVGGDLQWEERERGETRTPFKHRWRQQQHNSGGASRGAIKSPRNQLRLDPTRTHYPTIQHRTRKVGASHRWLPRPRCCQVSARLRCFEQVSLDMFCAPSDAERCRDKAVDPSRKRRRLMIGMHVLRLGRERPAVQCKGGRGAQGADPNLGSLSRESKARVCDVRVAATVDIDVRHLVKISLAALSETHTSLDGSCSSPTIVGAAKGDTAQRDQLVLGSVQESSQLAEEPCLTRRRVPSKVTCHSLPKAIHTDRTRIGSRLAALRHRGDHRLHC